MCSFGLNAQKKKEENSPAEQIFNKTKFQTVSSFDGSMFVAPENHPDIMHLKVISSLKDAKNVTFSASDSDLQKNEKNGIASEIHQRVIN